MPNFSENHWNQAWDSPPTHILIMVVGPISNINIVKNEPKKGVSIKEPPKRNEQYFS